MKNYTSSTSRRLSALFAGVAVLAVSQAAFAADAAKDATTVDELTVTARFRQESVNTVPIALSVVSGDAMAKRNLNNMEGLAQAVPSIDFRTGGGNKDRTIFVRGVGTITTSPGVEPSVSTVLDGIVLSRPGQSTMDLVDVQRVEVLRGPQGTLFGKNASAGVINIVSKDPTNSPAGYGEASYFSGNEYRVKGGVSGPIIDGKLSGLISAMAARYDGNVTDVLRGSKINGYSRSGARTKFIATPSDNLTVTFGADYIQGKESTPNGVFSSTNRVAYPTGVVTANAGLATLLAGYGVTASADNKKAVASIGTLVRDRNAGGFVQLDYKLGDLNLTSITGYRFWKNHQVPDFDNLPVLTSAFPDVRDDGIVDSIQRTQEFRVTSPKGGFFDYVAGFYFMDAETKEIYKRELRRLVGASTLFDSGQANYGIVAKNYALYGEGNFNFTSQLRGLVGFRELRDELSYYHVRTATTAVALTGIRPFHQSSGSTSKDGWSGRVGLQYDINDHQMVYVTASRGYKGPAYNAFFNMQAQDEISLKPETSNAYEAGVKGSLFEGKLIGSLAVFDTKFQNYQANFTDTVQGAFVTRLINAGDVSSKGVEGDFTARPVDGLRLGFSFARTDAKVDSFKCPTGSPVSCNINGQPLPFAPKWKTHYEAEYTTRFNDDFNLQASTDYSWKSKTQYSLSETPDTVQESYGIWNAGIGLVGTKNGWSARAQVKNINNQHYSPFVGYGSVAGVVRFVPRDNDRYYGLTLRKDF